MNNLKEDINNLLSIHKISSQEELDIRELDEFISEIAKKYKMGIYNREDMKILNRCLGKEYLNNTLFGHSLKKPYGYAGDFMIIDKIYTKNCTKISNLKNWDIFYHKLAAPKAVRNRKRYFVELLSSRINNASKPLSLLNVASGPGRDLYELYKSINSKMLRTNCIEYDKNAIEYAKRLNNKYLTYINFINKNILKYNTQNKYDIIWSAGLFDYFSDKLFLSILKQFSKWINPGGEIIIGNFSPCNPTKDFMEVLMEWKLIYRSQHDLINLAIQAGFRKNQITIGKETLGVNLFLHISV